MNREQIEAWLFRNKELINISAFERDSGCPKDTIRKFLQSKQGIATKHLNNIASLIQNMSQMEAPTLRFETKAASNQRRKRAFLELSPLERWQWFINASFQLARNEPKRKSHNNFVLYPSSEMNY